MLIATGKSVRQISPALWQDNFSLYFMALAFLAALAGLVLLGFFLFRLPPQIPLFYSRPWGEEQLASPTQALWLPASVFLVFGLNLLLIGLLAEEKLVLRTLSLASAVGAFLSLFAEINIIRLSL